MNDTKIAYWSIDSISRIFDNDIENFQAYLQLYFPLGPFLSFHYL